MPTHASKSIFVSSTFRDMQAERDMLRDYVLPRVNAFAAQYGRRVEFVDLRWGVDTSSVTEAEQNLKVLRTCLDEIRRSRPLFIGLLGDRYGWVPPAEDMQAALSAMGWHTSDLNQSVTALEIEYGALRAEVPPVCLFYFRQSPNYAPMPAAARAVYTGEDDAGRRRLEDLKSAIREKFGAVVRPYTAQVEKSELLPGEDWARQVEEDIIDALRREWGEPDFTPPTWQQKETAAQADFRDGRVAFFTGRQKTLARLEAFCTGTLPAPEAPGAAPGLSPLETLPQDARMLMLLGEAGSGKSALMCRVMDAMLARQAEGKCFVLPFSCALTARGSQIENMLRYFIHLLCGHLGLFDDSEAAPAEKNHPGKPGAKPKGLVGFTQLKDRFVELLSLACQTGPVVAIVDGLDQLIPSGETRRMLWVSGRLPGNFRLLCSMLSPSGALPPEGEALLSLGGQVCPVPSIGEDDIAAIIHAIAARHHKQIGTEVVSYITGKQTGDGRQAAQNPLYLSLLVQDLAMMDRYEHAEVETYMAAGMSQPAALSRFMAKRIVDTPPDPEGAYMAVVQRLEHLVGPFAGQVLGLIAVSRYGLRESDLAGTFAEMETPFNPADFAWLRQLLSDHLVQGENLSWDFAHQSLRRALRRARPRQLQDLGHFLSLHLNALEQEDDWAAAELMHVLWFTHRPDVVASLLSGWYDKYARTILFAQGLSAIYTAQGPLPQADDFLFQVLEEAGPTRDFVNIASVYEWLVSTELPEDVPPAYRLRLHRRMMDFLEGVPVSDDAATLNILIYAHQTQGNLYYETGDYLAGNASYADALPLAERMAALDEAPYGHRQVAHISSLLALGSSSPKQAWAHLQRQLRAAQAQMEKTGDNEAYSAMYSAHEGLADFFRQEGKLDKALEHAEKTLEYAEGELKLSPGDSPILLQHAYRTLANILELLGRFDEQDHYLLQAVALTERLYEADGTMAMLSLLIDNYSDLRQHYAMLGQTAQQWELQQKILAMAQRQHRKLGSLASLLVLAGACHDHATLLENDGLLEEALDYYTQSQALYEQCYAESPEPEVLDSLSDMQGKVAHTLGLMGRTEEALALATQVLNTKQTLYAAQKTRASLASLKQAVSRMGELTGRTEEALEYMVMGRDLARSMARDYPSTSASHSLAVACNNLAIMYHMLGRHAEALETLAEGQAIADELCAQNPIADYLDLAATLTHSAAAVLVDDCRYAEAEALLKKCLPQIETVCETDTSKTTQDKLKRIYDLMGTVLRAQGRAEEVLDYCARYLAVCEERYARTTRGDDLYARAYALQLMGDALKTLDRGEEALGYYRRMLQDCRAWHGAQQTPDSRRVLANGLGLAAGGFENLHQLEEATRLYREAESLAQTVWENQPTPENYAHKLRMSAALFEIAAKQGQTQEALAGLAALLDDARREAARQPAPPWQNVQAQMALLLALSYFEADPGRYAGEAAALLGECAAICRPLAAGPENTNEKIMLHSALYLGVICQTQLQQYEQALTLCHEALPLMEEAARQLGGKSQLDNLASLRVQMLAARSKLGLYDDALAGIPMLLAAARQALEASMDASMLNKPFDAVDELWTMLAEAGLHRQALEALNATLPFYESWLDVLPPEVAAVPEIPADAPLPEPAGLLSPPEAEEAESASHTPRRRLFVILFNLYLDRIESCDALGLADEARAAAEKRARTQAMAATENPASDTIVKWWGTAYKVMERCQAAGDLTGQLQWYRQSLAAQHQLAVRFCQREDVQDCAIGYYKYAALLLENGLNAAEAQSYAEKSARVLGGLLGDTPAERDYLLLSESLAQLSGALMAQDDYPAGEACAHRWLKAARAWQAAFPGENAARAIMLASILLDDCLTALEKPDELLELRQQYIPLVVQLELDGPTPPQNFSFHTELLLQQGEALMEAGRHEEALPHLERAAALAARMDDAGWQMLARQALGDCLLELARPEDALSAYTGMVDAGRAIVQNAPDAQHYTNLAIACGKAMQTLLQLARPEEAYPFSAGQVENAILAAEAANTPDAWNALADALARQWSQSGALGLYEEHEALFARWLAVKRRLLLWEGQGNTVYDWIRTLGLWGADQQEADDPAGALPYFLAMAGEARALLGNTAGEGDLLMGILSLRRLRQCHQALGQAAEAMLAGLEEAACYERRMALMGENTTNEDLSLYSMLCNILGNQFRTWNQLEDAAAWLHKDLNASQRLALRTDDAEDWRNVSISAGALAAVADAAEDEATWLLYTELEWQLLDLVYTRTQNADFLQYLLYRSQTLADHHTAHGRPDLARPYCEKADMARRLLPQEE